MGVRINGVLGGCFLNSQSGRFLCGLSCGGYRSVCFLPNDGGYNRSCCQRLLVSKSRGRFRLLISSGSSRGRFLNRSGLRSRYGRGGVGLCDGFCGSKGESRSIANGDIVAL